ncbi:MAG TPA: TlpA disulfide reductase family protein [Steroidobacteraceae bacterium]|nr:TlpA disulfide reductase family protein [Steroidobacteraceae bacterium]
MRFESARGAGTAAGPRGHSSGGNLNLESATRRALLRGAAALTLTGLEAVFAPSVSANALRIGETAPPATLVALDGQRVSTSELLGHVVILTFWATWCGPCREELPLLSAYAARHAADGLKVLGFALDSPEDDSRKVQQVAHSLSFPVGLLANSSLPGYGRIWRIPVNFTINREGQLIDNGWKEKDSTWTAERLDRVVTPLLENST